MATQPVEPSEHELWVAERRKGIGGSDVHHLFPVLDLNDESDTGSRYGCPRQLAYEKLGVQPDYQHSEETLLLFERGNFMEQAAADKYSEKTGRKVFRVNQMLVSKDYPFMVGNIDRRIKADERGVGVLECKSANEFAFNRMMKEGLPLSYALQFQHYLFVAGVAWGAFALIQPDSFQFVHFELTRNEDLIALLIQTEQKFWRLIEAEKLPDPLPQLKDDRCGECLFRKTCRGAEYDRLNARIQRDKDGIKYAEVTDGKLIQLVTDRLQLDGTIDKLEALKTQTNLEIQQCFPQGRDALVFPSLNGVKIRWREHAGARRWDTAALDSDAALISEKLGCDFLEKYKRQSAPTRPFVVTPAKEK